MENWPGGSPANDQWPLPPNSHLTIPIQGKINQKGSSYETLNRGAHCKLNVHVLSFKILVVCLCQIALQSAEFIVYVFLLWYTYYVSKEGSVWGGLHKVYSVCVPPISSDCRSAGGFHRPGAQSSNAHHSPLDTGGQHMTRQTNRWTHTSEKYASGLYTWHNHTV